jgi:acetyl-CoA carboxylase biotin carboxylase subunit/propionyl-CoA carboxylase alpha chain
VAGEFSTRFIEEHLAELVATFRDRNAEDEVLKVARYVAEITALGPQGWM